MRYQGRITDWRDDRGFGFITPNGGGAPVFVHISAFGKGQQRPAGNELVTYELINDEKKGLRTQNVAYLRARQAPRRARQRRNSMPIIAALFLAVAGIYGWQHISSHSAGTLPHAHSAAGLESTTKFQCQGKRHCSEMTSCEEATFYLRNCPGVEIDGDGDGIPCESQWCGG
jgi:cold shock CspA family protein